MLISHWLKSLRNRLHRSVRPRVSKKRRNQRIAPRNLTASVELLEERLLLTLQLISIFPNAGMTQPEETGGRLQQNEVLEVAPRELVFRFNPGQTINPASLNGGIQVFRSGFDGDFSNGQVPVEIGSLQIGDQPNEVILRFASTLPDDRYKIVVKGSGSNPLRNTAQELFNGGVDLEFFFEVDRGPLIEAVVHQPIVREQILDVTDVTNLTDGVTFTVKAGGKPITFEFDSDGVNNADNDNVFAINISSATTAAQFAAQIGIAIQNAAAVHGNAFGLDAVPGSTSSSIVVSANADTTFTPVFTSPVNLDGNPVAGLTIADGAIEQRENFIIVYFNVNDPLNAVSTPDNPTTAESPAFYQVIGTDGTLRLPDEVVYNADAGVATLRFNAPLGNGTYNLRIGESAEATHTLHSTVNLGTRFGNVTTTINEFIGGDPTKSALDPNDIDLYRFEILSGGDVTITLSATHGLDGFARLFDAAGNEIGTLAANNSPVDERDTQILPVFGLSAGVYVVGVSSQGNQSYNATNGTGASSGTTTGSYRLTITPDVAPVATTGTADDNSSFDTATNLGNLGTAGQVVSAQIQPQNASFNLQLPLEPGGNDEPGHRDIPVAGENHINSRGIGLSFPGGIPTIAYTFDLNNPNGYGVDPQGNTLFNAITLDQQQRTREIFELYSYVTGIQFVEAESRAEAGAQGLGVLTIVTGDLRALDPNIPTGPGGPSGIAGSGIAIMDAGENFSAADNLYGAFWFRTAMHEIGHLLGLAHTYDLPSIMGAALGGEPVFPGDHDITHIRRLFRRHANDIDMYQFDLTEAGTVTIETIAERFPLPETASQLNTVLRLYRQEANGSRTFIAQNDDYYGNDSFISLRLRKGTYFVGVSSVGNEDYDPTVSNSGSAGLTEGRYELRLNLRPDLEPIPDDPGTVNPLDVSARGRSAIRDANSSPQFDGEARKPTAIDGDADGRAGGEFNFSFQVGSTIFVDKVAGNYAISSDPLGSITNPFREIDLALAAAEARQANFVSMNISTPVIVRIVGNGGGDGHVGTLEDNVAYEIGITNDPINPQVLVDGARLSAPRNVNIVIDAGAVFKLHQTNISVGSSAQGIDRSGGSLQILGTTFNDVIFTSWRDDSIGGDSDGVSPGANPGDWGGIVFREDSDFNFEYRATNTQRDIFFGNNRVYTFNGIPVPATDATLNFLAFGNFFEANENLTIEFLDANGQAISGAPVFVLFNNVNETGANLSTVTALRTLTSEELSLVAGTGTMRIRVTPSVNVSNLPEIESLRVDLSVGTAIPIFLNTVNHATILYAGGAVVVDSISRDFDAIHLTNNRPTISYNTITLAANAAISANPNSFIDTFEDPRRYDHHLNRFGPNIVGNTVIDNSLNGLRVRTELQGGVPLERLQVSARFSSTDIVHVITENFVIDGSPGGLIINPGADPDIFTDDVITKRTPGRLLIDPGVIVKLAGSRIEMQRGGSNLIAEGTPEDPIIFTSLNDDTFGTGGTFDTTNDSKPPQAVLSGNGSFETLSLNNGGGAQSLGDDGLPTTAPPVSPEILNAALLTFQGEDGSGKNGPLARLGWALNILFHEYQAYLAAGSQGVFQTSQVLLQTSGDRALLELTARAGQLGDLRTELSAAGYQILAEAGSVIAVLVPMASLDELVNLQPAGLISPVYTPVRNVGSTTSQGDIALNADVARGIFNVDGTGITIGVLSDSFNTSGNGSYALDQSTNDLPGPGNTAGRTTPVSVIQEFTSPFGTSDEGRAMLQLIHDVAPGANLAFATAAGGKAVFAQNILALRDAGANVIVDDIIYLAESMFQDDLIAQAVDAVVADGVSYFSAVGNQAKQSYESAFFDSGVVGLNGGVLHDFNRGVGPVDTIQNFTLDADETLLLTFQWDDPFFSVSGGGGAQSDLDVLVFDAAGNVIVGASALTDNIGGDAVEIVSFTNTTGATATFGIGFELFAGPAPTFMKYIDFRGVNFTEHRTDSPSSFGHSHAVGAQAVGAAFYADTPAFGVSPPVLEPFSSTGGINIFFDTDGNRLATPEFRTAPGIVAPDGTNTTFFGVDVDGDGFPNFFGTSAAAPHAAAVAGLMLQAAGGLNSLTPGQIYNVMESTAIDMGPPGFDAESGFGLLDAFQSVREAQLLTGNVLFGQQPQPGDWAGLVFNAASSGNLDYVEIRYGGGLSPVAGGDAAFNAVEIIQADVRISNSIFEDNADGQDTATTSANRVGRGANESATIFVRGAQPTIVNNIIQNNEGYVISINANAMQAVINNDSGRATGPIFTRPLFGSDDPNLTTEYANNFGPLVRNNRLTGNQFNGMQVRGGTLTTQTIWDDTDIVHILREEIVVPNLHTFGGLRLQSSTSESLVVKLAGPNAGFTASGSEADIDDRVGGTLEILGTPGRPVVLTSLFDNSVGAGFQPDGTPLLNTVDPSSGQPSPGDWRSVRLDRFSNDRNVAVHIEREPATRLENDTNNIPNIQPNGAESLGILAPSQAAADDNRRAGYEIHGFINLDDPTDQDVYSFTGTAGTEVWFDIDRTAGSLDTVLELINADGSVVFARSRNSIDEEFDPSLLDGIGLPMRKDQRLGGDFYTTNPKDAGMRVILPGTLGTTNTYFIRVRSNGPSLDPSAPGYDPSKPGEKDGLTSGHYQLQIRLRQRDEHPGSTVTLSQIRYATNGIEVFGLPGRSPFVGEGGEGRGNNNSQATANNLGNLLSSDLSAFSVAGNLSAAGDLDFYQFNITYQGIQQIPGVNSPADVSLGFPTIFDIDWADGLARANTSLYIFNAQGQLILVGTNSNIADDQPGPLAGNDLTDPSRGSVGKLDPFIGTIELPEGTYFAAVTANANMPSVLAQYVNAGVAANVALTRLEPVDSINRIAEDHIGTQGGMTFQNPNTLTQLIDLNNSNIDLSNPNRPAISLNSSIVPWHLGDVSLFVSTGGGSTTYYTVDPFTGVIETRLNNTNTLLRDIAIRRQDDRLGGNTFTGDLVGFQYNNAGLDQSNFLTIDSGNGATFNTQNEGINTYTLNAQGNIIVDNHGLNINALTYSDGPGGTGGLHAAGQTQIYAVGTNFGDFADPLGATRNVLYRFNLDGTATSTGTDRNPEQAFASVAKTDIVERGILDTAQGGTPGSVLVAPSGAAINAAGMAGDGHVFQLNDNGVPLVFEMDAGPSVQFNVNVNNSQFIQDGDTITIDGVTYEFNTGAVIEVTALDVNGLTDGDTFTLTDSLGVMRTFEFDKGDGLNDLNNIGINVATGNRLAIVNAIVAAINGAGFGVTATNLGNALNLGRITLTGDVAIVDGTTTGINIDPDAYDVEMGNIAIDVEETFSANQLAFATAVVVNMNPGGRGALNNLLNFPTRTTIDNITTVRTNVVVNRGTSGGIAGTNFEIDFFFSDTADEVAAAIGQEINTQLGAGTVTVTGNLVTLQSPQDNFDLVATDIPPFDITGGGTGGTITGLAVLNGTLFAITDVGGLFIINNPTGRQTASLTFIGTVAGGAAFQGLSTGPQNVENGRYANMLFGITQSGELYAFNTAGVLQPIFLDGATSVSTGLTGATGLEFSNLDRNLWHATTDRGTDAGHGINPLFNDSIHGVNRARQGGTSLYFGNEPTNSAADNSMGGLAGGAHGTVETNTFSLQGYSGDDLPTLYFNYFLESQDQDVLLNQVNQNPTAMLDSLRMHIWNSSAGRWEMLVTNNSERDPRTTVFNDEYDYQLPPGTAEDRYIQEAFNFGEGAGQWRQIRVNLSPYAGMSDLRLRFDFSSDGSMNLGDADTTGTEVRAQEGSLLQDGQTITIDGVTFEFDLGFTVHVPSGAHFTAGDSVTVTAPSGAVQIFSFGAGPGTIIPFAATDTAETLAIRLTNAINAAGLVNVTAIRNGARVNITANGAGAPFNVELNSATAGNSPTAGLFLDPFDGAGVSGTNVALVVNAGMTSTQVADVIRLAVAEVFVDPSLTVQQKLQTVKIYKDVVRIIGREVTGQANFRTNIVSTPGKDGRLEVANSLQGDEFGRFYTTPTDNQKGLDFRTATSRRLANYNFEGVYIDDIIIGFAERGEIATGAPTGTSNFIANPSSNPSDIDEGSYQLEIRRGTEYSLFNAPFGPHAGFNTGTMDTNARLSGELTIVIPDGSQIFDGQKFQLSDGTNTATFEFNDLDLIVGDPNFGVAPSQPGIPNFAIGFRATESAAVIAARLRTLLNSTAVRNHLKLTAAMASGGVNTNPGRSNEVNIHGNITANTRGDVSSAAFNIAGTLPFRIFSFPGAEFVFTGDRNVERLQGSIQIAQNFIFDTLNVGILVDDNIRRPGTDQPVIGVPRQLPTPNDERLTRGVKIVNNVVAHFGDGGIVLNGVTNPGNVPLAAVPFHRVINNTIYGGLTPNGDGVRVSNNVAPTLLNNIIANTQTGINNATGGNSIVVTRSAYQNNVTNGINGTSAQFLFAGEPLFVDPSTNNFYLAAGARPIDSARNQFEDRDPIVQVGASIGIPQSNLFAPLFDAFGQFRFDDPTTPNTGEGNPPFFDRGAVERVDNTGPTARLIAPIDNDGTLDLDPAATFVFLENAVIRQFIVGLDDVGIGVDDTSVSTNNVQLTFNGQTLVQGVDYLFRYNANTKQISLVAASGVFNFGDYRINLVNQNGIRDLAGNNLQPNRQPSGTTAFDITISPPPVISVQPVTVTEGDEGEITFAEFVVTLSSPTGLGVTVNIQTVDGTATSTPGPEQDFVAQQQQLVFNPGDPLTQSFFVTIIGDNRVEGDETFFLLLSDPVNATIAQGSTMVQGTIRDDELVVRLISPTDPPGEPQLEGDEGTTDMIFTVQLINKHTGELAEPRGFDVSVDFATSDGTAIAGEDYVATMGTVTILSTDEKGTATFAVPIIGDEIQEVPALESFFVTLSNPVNAVIDQGFGQVTGTILDDDPKFRVNDPVVVEGDSGIREMLFTVSVSSPVVSPISIDFETQDGTAIAGVDYLATSGTLTFNPGDPLTQTVAVEVIGNTIPQGPQTLSLVLSNPTAGGIAKGTGTGTIIDDDPRITIDNVAMLEGDSGTTDFVFTVTLSEPSPFDVQVDFETSIGSGVTPPPAGSIFEFPSDSLANPMVLDPRAFVTTANPNITDSQGVDISTTIPHVTILGRGDDTFDFFSFNGTVGQRVILDIDGATFDTQLFLFDSAGNVVASNNVGFVNGGPLGNGLDAGSLSVMDSFLELVLAADDTYTIGVGRFDSVATDTGLEAGPSGLAIKEGDQYTLHISIEGFSAPPGGMVIEVEPNNTFATAQNLDDEEFTLDFNPDITNQAGTNVSTTIPWVSISGTGDGTADFFSVTAEAGQIGIFDIDGASFDTILTVFRPDGSILAINDDDPRSPTLDSFIQVVFPTTGLYVFQVTQFGAQTNAVPNGATYTLNVAIEGHALGTGGTVGGGPILPDGTADPNSDFIPVMGTLTIAAGQTTGTITVPVLGDLINEPNETFFVRLSNAVNAVIEDGVGKGIIINDDAPIISLINPPPTPETGAFGTPNVMTFIVSLSRPADVVTTIDFTTADNTAVAGFDYVPVSGTLTFQIGEQTKTINVQLIKDGELNEGIETFFLLLSNPMGADFDGSDPKFVENDPSTTADDQLRGVGTILDTTGLVERVLTVVAPDAGQPGIVRVMDSLTGNVRFEFEPYAGFLGGVRIATGDVNNNGTADIITVPGPGGGPHVKVFSGVDGSLLMEFMAFDPSFTGGLFVATGDFAEGVFTQGDSFADIIISADAGGGPHVRVFSSATGPTNNRVFTPLGIQNRLLFDFFAYSPAFTGGVRVAAGDVTGDGTDDLVVAAGPGGGPHVQVFNGRTRSTTPIRSFFAYDPRFAGGVYLAVADVDITVPTVGRAAEIITSPGAGGGPHVRVFNVVASPVVVSQFFAYNSNFLGGVRVSAGDVNRDTFIDIITSPGPGGGPHVRAFDGRTVPGTNLGNPPTALASLFPFAPTFTGGLFVAGVLGVDNGQPLRAEEIQVSGSDTPLLTQEDLDAAVEAALDRLRAAGVSEADLETLRGVHVSVADLGGDLLGLARRGSIVLDVDAAGNGWFIDPTPDRDEEFSPANGNSLAAVDASAVGRVDLLTVVLHELAHKLGLEDLDPHLHPDVLMTATLPVGTRRLPNGEDFDEAFTDESLFDALLLA